MNEELKKQIDEMSYTQLLSNWRLAPVGSPYFQGEVGDYYKKVMAEKQTELKEGEHSEISKGIGWNK